MASPISLESPARQLQELREQQRLKKVFFLVGDQVYIMRCGRPRNGVIKNYDGRSKKPYQVFFYDGEMKWVTVKALFVGNVVARSNQVREKPPSLLIQTLENPVLIHFD